MKPILMPKLGLTMEEGTLIRWLKTEGDLVEKGDILFDVETDKSVNEVAALISGTLGKIVLNEGETAQILQVIGFILEPGEEPPAEWPQPITFKSTSRTENKADELNQNDPTAARQPKKASPRALRLAEEKGIKLEVVKGTGPNGRITEEDVIQYSNAHNTAKVSRLQRLTAERMVKSFSTVPHFYLKVEVDASRIVDWRKKLLPGLERMDGLHLTLTDLFILLAAQVLKMHPQVNSTWEDGQIHFCDLINVSLAITIEEGLVAPVIKNADFMTIKEIVIERKRLVERAAGRKLSLDELEGGTFTITNLGMYSVDEFAAIINPPQSSTLAVGRIADRVVVEDGQMVIKPTVFLTLSIDHRVMDGAGGAKFLTALKNAMEAPDDIFLASGAGDYLVS